MGSLINGKWETDPSFNMTKTGSFNRPDSVFRHTISPNSTFTPEKDRYHLYVSHACPWAHRTLIMRALKNLESIISVDVVHPDMEENGWKFGTEFPESTNDRLYNASYLYNIYQMADPNISCRVTVPVLWDKHSKTIVNNESSEIIRLFNTAFNDITGNTRDYFPKKHQDQIESWNTLIYDTINNGVYKAGFAQSQESYTNAVSALFETLETLNTHLQSNDYLVANTLTEADIRLLPTLLRFDCVYHTHFKCNKKLIKELPHLHAYVKRCYSLPAIKATTFFEHITRHYYYSHKIINPYQIIPIGPELGLD
ncbi:glutathione S-transferase family protein [bacterium]|nr:glutathione S-transferase family protein [bacterium]